MNKLSTMKFLCALSLGLVSSAALAQQADAEKPKGFLGSSGYFGAVSGAYSRIAGQNAYWLGGRAGLTFSRVFSVGLGSTSLLSGKPGNPWNPAERKKLDATYGGLYLEPALPTHGALRLAFPVLLGGGAVYNDDDFLDLENRFPNSRHDGFLVVEPGLTAEVNILKHVVLGAGATYRYTSGLRLPNSNNDLLNGFTGGLIIKVGRF